MRDAYPAQIAPELAVTDFSVIENDPDRLAELKGISPKRARMIHDSLCQQLSMRRLLDFLSAYDLPLQIAMPVLSFSNEGCVLANVAYY